MPGNPGVFRRIPELNFAKGLSMRNSSRMRTLAVVMVLLFAAGALHAQESRIPYDLPARKAQVLEKIDAEIKSLDALYKFLHVHPELSYEEEKTAARMAKELKALGFEIAQNIGGHGVVGVLKNGDGPTVLIRTDMDALPVVEKTNLPYAS